MSRTTLEGEHFLRAHVAYGKSPSFAERREGWANLQLRANSKIKFCGVALWFCGGPILPALGRVGVWRFGLSEARAARLRLLPVPSCPCVLLSAPCRAANFYHPIIPRTCVLGSASCTAARFAPPAAILWPRWFCFRRWR